jgi:hypothetical protein
VFKGLVCVFTEGETHKIGSTSVINVKAGGTCSYHLAW